MTKMVATTLFMAAFAAALVPHVSAQTLFVAPITDSVLGDDGPTRYEYIMNLGDRSECDTVVPVAREALADYTVWFEFEERHYALVWDAAAASSATGTTSAARGTSSRTCARSSCGTRKLRAATASRHLGRGALD